MHRSLPDELTLVDTNFADAPSNREAAGLGELAPVHEARSALETREEAVRLDPHDGICKYLLKHITSRPTYGTLSR